MQKLSVFHSGGPDLGPLEGKHLAGEDRRERRAESFQQLSLRGDAGGEGLAPVGCGGSAVVLDAGPRFPNYSLQGEGGGREDLGPSLAGLPSEVLSWALPYFLLVCGGDHSPWLPAPVYMGECLVCLVFGCLLSRVLMGPWC